MNEEQPRGTKAKNSLVATTRLL